MSSMGEFFTQLEKYDNLEPEIIKTTKIHKVLKAIIKLASIPKEEDFEFKRRSADLLVIWNKCLEGMNQVAKPSPGQRWLQSLQPAAAAKEKNVKRKA